MSPPPLAALALREGVDTLEGAGAEARALAAWVEAMEPFDGVVGGVAPEDDREERLREDLVVVDDICSNKGSKQSEC